MSKPLKPRRGTTAEQNAFVGEAHEITYDTDKNTLVCRDGLTAGGFPLQRADLQAAKDAEQDAAISAAQSTANAKIASIDMDGLDLVLTYGDGTVKRVQVPAGKSVGDLWFGFDPMSKPANVQTYEGQLLSRAAYVAHSAFVLGGRRKVLSEDAWQEYVAEKGFCPFYSSGDGSTTYRMPLMDGVHPKFVAAWAEAGQYVEAGLPNITGTFAAEARLGSSAPKGAFYYTGKTTEGAVGGGTDHIVGLDASRSSPVYGNSDSVQPPAVTMVVGEYVVGSVAVVGEADSESLLASVTHLESSKMEADAIGAWVFLRSTVFNTTALGTYTVDLSGYLPNTGDAYDVLGSMYVSRADTSGTNTTFTIVHPIATDNEFARCQADGANFQQGSTAFAYPVGVDRKMTIKVDGYAPSVSTVILCAYRRVI